MAAQSSSSSSGVDWKSWKPWAAVATVGVVVVGGIAYAAGAFGGKKKDKADKNDEENKSAAAASAQEPGSPSAKKAAKKAKKAAKKAKKAAKKASKAKAAAEEEGAGSAPAPAAAVADMSAAAPGAKASPLPGDKGVAKRGGVSLPGELPSGSSHAEQLSAARGAMLPPKAFPEDHEMSGLIMQSMEAVQQGTADMESAQVAQMKRWVTHMDAGNYSPDTRMMAAQWLILYYTLLTISARTAEDYKDAVTAQRTDMSVAWELLNMDPSDGEMKRAFDLLRLDVGQRLRSHEKMIPIFERVVALDNQMNYEEMVVAFTTAPLLGRWRDTLALGERLMENNHDLDQFHEAALERPDMPDYKILYDLAEEEAKRGDMDPEHLAWRLLGVAEQKMKLVGIECEDAATAARVRQSLEAKETDAEGWAKVPVGDQTRMMRLGGIAQMISLSQVPIPMVGPMNNSRLNVSGFMEISPPGQPKVKQLESYSLARTARDADGNVVEVDHDTGDEGSDPNGHSVAWEGDYVLLQERLGAESGMVKITFNIRMKFKRGEQK